MTTGAVALVGIDSIFISEEATARAREAITAATQIPGAHVLIGASHTHGGGPVATCFESEADPEYVELVAKRVAEAVITAYHALHAAELGDGIGHEPRTARSAKMAPWAGQALVEGSLVALKQVSQKAD